MIVTSTEREVFLAFVTRVREQIRINHDVLIGGSYEEVEFNNVRFKVRYDSNIDDLWAVYCTLKMRNT